MRARIEDATKGPNVRRTPNFETTHALWEFDSFGRHVVHGTDLGRGEFGMLKA